MDILTIARSVFRRWYVVVPIVAGALAVAFYMNSTIPPQYEAQGQILLASPDLDPSNLPRSFVDLGELAGLLVTDAVQAPLLAGDASIDVSASGDTLALVVSSSSPTDSRTTNQNIIAWLGEQVEDRQADEDFEAGERLVLQSATQAIEDADEPLSDDEAEFGGAASVDGAELATTIQLDDPAARVVNPFGASNQTARVLTVAIQSDEGRRRVAERSGPGVSFSLGQDARDAAAIMTITTVGADPQAVLDAFDHVTAELRTSLADREARAEVPPTRRTRIEPIAAPQSVIDVSPPLDRSVAAIIGLGGLAAIAVAVMIDSIAARRRPKATGGGGPEPTFWSDRPASGDVGFDGPSSAPTRRSSSPDPVDPHDDDGASSRPRRAKTR